MDKIELISSSSKETMNIAKKLANYLKKGDIVILNGDLGMGKTKFVEGFLEKYNLQDEISSPTFNIVNEYIENDNIIYHFDVYRLENCDEFYQIGGDEYFGKGICLIEWGEMIKDCLPESYIEIFIKNGEMENQRFFEIKSIGNNIRYKNILFDLKNELIN